MNGQIIYKRQSISPIVFRFNALGTQEKIIIAGFKGAISTPHSGPKSPADFSQLMPPTGFDDGVLSRIEEAEEEKTDWGKQLTAPNGETAVESYLLQFEVAKTKTAAMKHMEHIEVALDNWFALLRDWVEVLTYQDLSVDEPLSGVQDTGNFMWSWKSKKIWRNAVAAAVYITLRTLDVSKAIDLATWRKAVAYANKGIRPPEEHLIFRDARARFLRKQYKYSAIFLGITTELTLKKKLEHLLTRRGRSKRLIDNIINSTLGKIIDTCEALGVALPADIRLTNATRNNAVHKDGVIARDDVLKVINATEELLKLHSSL